MKEWTTMHSNNTFVMKSAFVWLHIFIPSSLQSCIMEPVVKIDQGQPAPTVRLLPDWTVTKSEQVWASLCPAAVLYSRSEGSYCTGPGARCALGVSGPAPRGRRANHRSCFICSFLSFCLQPAAGTAWLPVWPRRQVQPGAKGSAATTAATAATHSSLPALKPRLQLCARPSAAFIPLMELCVYVNMQGSRLKV